MLFDSKGRANLKRLLKATTLCALTLPALLAAQNNADWTIDETEGRRILTGQYPEGKLTVIVYRLEPLGPQRLPAWLELHANKVPDGYRLTNQPAIEPDGRGGAFVRRYLRGASGPEIISMRIACAGPRNTVRMIDAVSDRALFVRHSSPALMDLMKLRRQICRYGANRPQSKRKTSNAIQLPTPTRSDRALLNKQLTPTAPISAAAAPPGLTQLRGVNYFGTTETGDYGLTFKVIALFDDGTYTEDLVGAMNTGVASSRKKQPNRWGQWRAGTSVFEFKARGDQNFDDTNGTWANAPAAKNARLHGCYRTRLSNARAWCFMPNGRFTHDVNTLGATLSVAAKTSAPNERGRYHLDGYTARFVYDDGTEFRAAFGWLNKQRTHMGLNGERLRTVAHSP